ncbi:hypothetical protein H4R19_001432 [Coemansia spiralis]|nr:hypothetical protein H4R19_001432 [Coemansia spiralis]
MDLMSIVPLYRTVLSHRETQDSQREREWAAREADRKHRERVRELTRKRHSELSLWIPARFRKPCPPPAELPEPKPTTIQWAD